MKVQRKMDGLSRRSIIRGIGCAAAFACMVDLDKAMPEETAVTQPVVRLSRATFAGNLMADVRKRLADSQKSLIPAIRQLHGCLHYWAAIDESSCSMINVSVWERLEDAEQMDTLEPMRKLGTEFAAIGVQFERPITNYRSIWEI